MTLIDFLDASEGETWRSLAAKVGCSHNHLFQVANGDKDISMRLARRIEEVTKGRVTVAELARLRGNDTAVPADAA